MESLEIQLARMDERMKHLIQLQSGQTTNLSELNDTVNTSISSISQRLTKLEHTIANAGPALSEYAEIKHQIIGAGRFGKWVWAAVGAVLTFVITVKGIIPWQSGG